MSEKPVIVSVTAAEPPYRVWWLSDDLWSDELISQPVVCWLVTHQRAFDQELMCRVVPGVIEDHSAEVSLALIDHESCVGVYPEGVVPAAAAIEFARSLSIPWSKHKPGCKCSFAEKIECHQARQL